MTKKYEVGCFLSRRTRVLNWIRRKLGLKVHQIGVLQNKVIFNPPITLHAGDELHVRYTINPGTE